MDFNCDHYHICKLQIAVVTIVTFHRAFPDLTGLSECSEDLLHVTINS